MVVCEYFKTIVNIQKNFIRIDVYVTDCFIFGFQITNNDKFTISFFSISFNVYIHVITYISITRDV